MKKRICFVLCSTSPLPSGGYKMVYTYANRLAERGHVVTIMFMNMESLTYLPGVVRGPALKISIHLRPRWIKLDKRIKRVSYSADMQRWEADYKNDFDRVIATELKTAAFVESHFDGAEKIYFIQDFENWDCSDDEVYATYRMNMKKIVISEWLKEIVDRYSPSSSIIVKNPIQTDIYCVRNNIQDRSSMTVGMLYHIGEHKGCSYAIEALQKVKEMYPNLKVKAFGTAERTEKLPEWIEYKKDASQEDTVNIYNNVSIWLCATIEEGFGLTGLEAIACGAALVSTDYRGVKEYAVNEKNALLSPVRDVEALKNNLIRLIENKEERIQLAQAGVATAKEFSMKDAVDRFEKVIIE